MEDLGQDNYGRKVTVTRGTDLDTYRVYLGDILSITLELPSHRSDSDAFSIINSMAPG